MYASRPTSLNFFWILLNPPYQAKLHPMPNNQLAIREHLQEGSPLQQLLGDVLDELGGIDFIVGWAEENPSEFMRILVAASGPTPTAPGTPGAPNSSAVLNLHLHPALAPGPLDVVSDQ